MPTRLQTSENHAKNILVALIGTAFIYTAAEVITPCTRVLPLTGDLIDAYISQPFFNTFYKLREVFDPSGQPMCGPNEQAHFKSDLALQVDYLSSQLINLKENLTPQLYVLGSKASVLSLYLKF